MLVDAEERCEVVARCWALLNGGCASDESVCGNGFVPPVCVGGGRCGSGGIVVGGLCWSAVCPYCQCNTFWGL